jgi:hypothetical protein
LAGALQVALSEIGKSKLPEHIAEKALDDVMYALHVLEETANWARTVHTSSEKHLNNLRLLLRGWRQQAVHAYFTIDYQDYQITAAPPLSLPGKVAGYR